MLDILLPNASGGSIESFGSALKLFYLFAIFHALADYPLQGQFLALGKHRSKWVDEKGRAKHTWMYCLLVHSLIQSAGVWLVSGSIVFALIEFGLHLAIDFGKSRAKYGLLVDQSLHYLCKALYVVLIWQGIFV